MTEFTCAVSADLFRRAMACVSTEETRFYLHGVKVEPCPAGGVIMVSTDGTIMIVVRDPEGKCDGAAVVKLSPDTAKALKVKRHATPRSLTVSDGQARVLEGDELVHIQAVPALVDASYPDWPRAVPHPDTSGTPALHGHYCGAFLARMAAVLSSDSNTPSVEFYGEGPMDPHLAFGTDLIEAFGVVMPRREVSRAKSIDWAASPI